MKFYKISFIPILLLFISCQNSDVNSSHKVSIQFNDSIISLKRYDMYRQDTSRFIAHGAGVISGYDYTNSKEALDLSYSKGFRIFELDIMKTIDNEYVAVHNWYAWGKMTATDYNEPVELNEFMKYPIYGEYTPLNMDGINSWFLAHEDAILITDKINEPQEFVKQFVDKNRLMMELFDMDSVKSALDLGIKSVVLSHDLIFAYPRDELQKLNDMGIDYVTVSRYYVKDEKPFLKLLKDVGLKVFLYQISDEKGCDEDYVVKNELDYAYGMYANEWCF